MKGLRSYFFIIFSVYCSSSVCQPFQLSWQRITDGPKSTASIYAKSICTNPSGDFIVTGIRDTSFYGMILFIQKYHENGALLLQKDYYEPSGIFSVLKSITDINGSIYISGWKNGADFYILKFDSIGNFVWQYQSPFQQHQYNNSTTIYLCPDSLGNIYYGINVEFTSPFKTGVIGKIDSNGTSVWSFNTGNTFNFLQLLKLNSNINLSYVSGFYSDIKIVVIDSSGAVIQQLVDSNLKIGGNAVTDETGLIFLNSFDDALDTTVLVKITTSLSQEWKIPFDININGTFMKVKNQNIYTICEYQIDTLRCLDMTGNILWSAPMTDGQNQSINPTSDGKLFYSAKHVFPNNSIAVYFSIRDSVGQIIFQSLEFNYWEFFDHINKNDRYLIGQNGGMGKYECKLFGSNANLTDTFSTKYSNYQSKLDKALKILIDNNGDVILIGELSDTSLNSFADLALVVMKYSSNGVKIWQNTVISPSYSGGFKIKDLKCDSQNNIYICGDTTYSVLEYGAFIVKFNSSGQEQWRHYLTAPTQSKYTGNSLDIDLYENVYFAGKGYIDTIQQHDAFLVKINQSGIIQWTKYYSGNLYTDDDATDVIVQNGKIFLSVSSHFQQTTGDFSVLELDSSGNQIQIYDLNNGYYLTDSRMIIDSEGNFICYGKKNNPPPLPIDQSFSWYVSKTDSLGNLNYEWFNPTITNWPRKPLKATTDAAGNIYLIGELGHYNPPYYVALALDQYCNNIWTDTLNNAYATDIKTHGSYIYTTANRFLSYLGIVTVYDSTGQIVFRESMQGPKRHSSDFIDVDSSGFYFAGSMITDSTALDILLQKYSILSTNIVSNDLFKKLTYPNPASKAFYIQLDSPASDSQVSLFNLFGQQLNNFCIQNITPEIIKVEVPDLPDGIYIYKVFISDKLKYSGKISLLRS